MHEDSCSHDIFIEYFIFHTLASLFFKAFIDVLLTACICRHRHHQRIKKTLSSTMFWMLCNLSKGQAIRPLLPVSALILYCYSRAHMTFRCFLITHKHGFRKKTKQRGLNSWSPYVFIPPKAWRRNGEWCDTDDFLLHFSPISCCCVHLQLSHLICCFVAVSAAPTSLSRLSHCCWGCSDSGKAAMRSYLEERNIFHWAKSQWSRRMFELCCTQERLD